MLAYNYLIKKSRTNCIYSEFYCAKNTIYTMHTKHTIPYTHIKNKNILHTKYSLITHTMQYNKTNNTQQKHFTDVTVKNEGQLPSMKNLSKSIQSHPQNASIAKRGPLTCNPG